MIPAGHIVSYISNSTKMPAKQGGQSLSAHANSHAAAAIRHWVQSAIRHWMVTFDLGQ